MPQIVLEVIVARSQTSTAKGFGEWHYLALAFAVSWKQMEHLAHSSTHGCHRAL